jgi:hypothetical protein
MLGQASEGTRRAVLGRAPAAATAAVFMNARPAEMASMFGHASNATQHAVLGNASAELRTALMMNARSGELVEMFGRSSEMESALLGRMAATETR